MNPARPDSAGSRPAAGRPPDDAAPGQDDPGTGPGDDESGTTCDDEYEPL
jgi:hypothetical protein